MSVLVRFMVILILFAGAVLPVLAQSTTGSISGTVVDQQGAAVGSATVTARNVQTNNPRTAQTDDQGRYNFANLPIGNYEVSVEASGFAKYVQTGITLDLNQTAVVDVAVRTGDVTETVTVTENASLLNTTTSEVGVRFDQRRLSELPIAPNRNVFNVALSAAGVSQLGNGQSEFANGVSYSSNGGRLRSNNFMIDGQDTNDPSVSGGQQGINNPDVVQEVRLITNQFLAEYGRNSGSVLNIVTKSGTNDYHGSAFWFHNSNKLNALSNTDKAAGRTEAPFRIENQIGGTLGGPLTLPRFGEGGRSTIDGKDRTFFFGSYQRWSNRELGSGFTLLGAPTEAGRQVLQSAVGSRPQVAALLRFLPVAQNSSGPVRTFTANGQNYSVPTGALTGLSSITFDSHQASMRVDHRFNENHTLSGRYLYNDSDSGGTGQVTPTGLTTLVVARAQAVNIALTSVLSPTVVNEARAAYSRYATVTNASDPSSELIPSIEINDLGLLGFNAAANRTAIGLAVNLPQFRTNNTYQIQDNVSITSGSHAVRFGADLRRTQLKSFFVPTIRGRLAYSTLQDFVDDRATLAATVNRPVPGGQEIQYYEYDDLFFFGQDEWKIRPNLTLTYGLRYEVFGNSIDDLVPVSDRIVATTRDERFRFAPVPTTDKNNFQPRVGINWNPRTEEGGALNFLTGGDRLVFRAGYARTNDSSFINLNLNVASAAPFVASINLPAVGAFSAIPSAQIVGINPLTLARTIVAADFRAPYTDQFTFEVQRELSSDVVMRVGYVGTKGTGLFQTVDGNPRLPTTAAFNPSAAPGSAANPCRAIIYDASNCTLGVRRLRANSASSIYHSMQVSVDKRLSRGFSAGVHYTWSAFIDTASEVFNPSGGEIALPQDSYNWRNDRARSGYDRPHRFTGNFVYELPFFQDQQGALGHLLGGFQVNSFFTFQSGSPFTPVNGADPTGALNGIDGLVGNAIRANVVTNLDVSRLSIEELVAARTAGDRLFAPLPTSGQRFGNAGRNILRADGIGNVDFGIIKNTNIGEGKRLQIQANMFNMTNTRNFSVPSASVISPAFLNQWTTPGGNRRIQLGVRYVF